MELNKIPITILETGLFFLLMSTLVSCQIGKFVNEDSRTALVKGGPHGGVWQISFVWINYHYALDRENIQLPGAIELRGNFGHQIGNLDFLKIWVNFLDTEGKILARNTIFYSG